ncbi:hypothetical protein N7510_003087 [Penicillium lagena]|uniref:uncharacterized protein n=1 Tax=Penicillium lagena TaxID=94218 RepID=UPI002540A56C|nr:uncharacterized protein N7510_003087 [Penicillium lagena]KAJ5619103.1 hypothetical protein N7510_003087 [Penicillium lagena]
MVKIHVLQTAALVACSLLPELVSSMDASAAAAGASGASALQTAEAAYPPCALECLARLIPQSACGATDVACLCTNVPLNNNITVCVSQGCSLVDELATKNASLTMCGAHVRDKTGIPGLVGVIGGAFALLTFFFRMVVCSPWIGRIAGWDDYTIAAAVALTVPPTVFSVYLGENGLGKDIWTLPLWKIENVLFYYYLGELFYVTAQAMIKLSLLFFLLRVFPDSKFRIACWVIIGLTAAYGFTFFMVTLLQCYPIPYTWLQLDETQNGKCNNENIQGWLSAIINIILDLIILVLPLKRLYLLNMGLKKKILTMCMFGLGVFDTIVSIVRLHSLITFANSENITWAYLDAAYWSTIELDIGIITACLPAVRLFFAKLGVMNLASTHKSINSRSFVNTGDSREPISESKRLQQALRCGDNCDFIPLVDVESGKSDKSWLRLAPPAPGTGTTENGHCAG